jgi:acetyl esterase/lipase
MRPALRLSSPRRSVVGLLVAASLLAGPATAQPAPKAPPQTLEISAPAAPDAIPLLQAPPKARFAEQWEQVGPQLRSVRNVSNPTLTPVLPDPAKATGAAVIIAPGGAFFMLSIDSEGYQAARWLADRGVAAFVLKYRTEETPRDRNEALATMGARMKGAVTSTPTPQTPAAALADAEAAVRLVRARAKIWGIDPARVGFLGFSAGGMTALSVGLTEDKAARPDFIAPIYPPMNPRAVPADAPPMFVAIALDDPLFAKGKPLGLIESWRTAGRPVEGHLYERGGHGFGMVSRTAAAALWPEEFYAWMKDRGLLRPKP